ncbi:hypothetical protein AQZ52_15610 [Novosphingobium fuchskuhlense]|uniref:Uncharacterized protein n=1 Tax=Novosphingobium fuchskuhlense TaxID=1117702 RepID=A0A124JTK3_9SPHN|nr:DUF805 domain-containing protein [Novosphingobium fuchskuhlense]KUR70279.1 hypothetical protein AQZ52_15610 [Novosphingobium fuchskuhlense]
MQQVTSHLRRLLSLYGCAGRKEFVAVLLVTWAVDLVLWFALDPGHVPVPHFPGRYVILFGGKGALAVLLTLAMHYPVIATAVRRCHDAELPGSFLFLFVVFLAFDGASAIYNAMGFMIGLPPASRNRYGPKARDPATVDALG